MKESNGGFWKGFFYGSIIGAGAGLLLAPMPGVETRARLSDTISNLGSNLPNAKSNVQEKLGHVSERPRQYVSIVRSRLAQSIEAGKQAAAVKRAELESEVESVTEPKPSM